MQGAVPSMLHRGVPSGRWQRNLDDLTPDCYVSYYTPGSPRYFSGVKGAGVYVNISIPMIILRTCGGIYPGLEACRHRA